MNLDKVALTSSLNGYTTDRFGVPLDSKPLCFERDLLLNIIKPYQNA